MSLMARVNPGTPCPPNGAHHPHRWECFDPDCGCDYVDGKQFSLLACCIDGQKWPCATKQSHRTLQEPAVQPPAVLSA